MRVIQPVAFLIFIVLIIHLFMRRAQLGRHDDAKSLLAREREANAARKAPIGEEYFLNPDVTALPAREYGEGGEDGGRLEDARRRALLCAARPMIRFDPPKSNYDVKMEFGPANLEAVADYEENFRQYTAALFHWAKLLMEAGFREDAKQTLRCAVDARADQAWCYTTLAGLYADKGDAESLRALLATASAMNDLPLKEKIEEEIRRCLTP